MKQVLESMTRVVTPKYTIRVWRDELLEYEYQPGLYTDIENLARNNEDDSPTMLAKKLAKLPRVTAVEVLGWDFNGIVYYPDWN